MEWHGFLLCCVGLMLINVCHGQVEVPKHVTRLTLSQAETLSSNHDMEAMILFVRQDCHTCENSITVLGLVAEHWKADHERFLFAIVDTGLEDIHSSLLSQYGLQNVPVFVAVKNGMTKEYVGQRAGENLFKFLTLYFNDISPVVTIKSKKHVKTFKGSDDVRVVGYFGDSEEAKAAYTAYQQAAEYFKLDIPFFVVKSPQIARGLGFKKARPVFSVWKPAEKPISFDSRDPWTPFKIIQFIVTNRRPYWQELRYENVHGVWYSTKVTCMAFLRSKSQGVWDDSSKRLFSQFKMVAKKLTGPDVNFLIVDGPQFKDVMKMYSISEADLPTMALFNVAQNRDSFLHNLDVEKPSSKFLESWIKDFIEGKEKKHVISASEVPEEEEGAVKVITRNAFEDRILNSNQSAMVEFYAPWCMHCKELAPIYEEVANYFEDEDILIGKFDCMANTPPEEYEIQGFPTLIFFGANAKDKPIIYDRPRDKESIIGFIEELAMIIEQGELVVQEYEEPEQHDL